MRLAITISKAVLAVSCLALAACGGANSDDSQSPTNTTTSKSSITSIVRAAAVGAGSPSGSTIPSMSQIIDSGGNIWTVADGVIHENGELAGYSKAVTLLLYDDKTIYQENSAGNWWSWNGSTWIATSDPPPVNGSCGTTNGMAVKTTPVANLCSTGNASTVAGAGPWTWSCASGNGGRTASCSANLAPATVVASPSGTTIPSATQIVDNNGHLWTVASGIIYENGSLAGYSSGVTLLLYDNNIIYQENAAGGWWSWTGNAWISSSDPRKVPVNGKCGTTNGMAVKTTPVANLCSTGTASTVKGSGPWTWSCAGSDGGTSASCAASLVPPTASSSPNGTTIPSATQIVDSGDHLWTLSGGVVFENGETAGYSHGVTLLLYENNIIYQQNSAGNWWAWTSGTWVSSSDPRSVTGTGGGTGVTKPTISGSPPSSAVAGEAYNFVPTTTNPGGGTLSFSIANMPAWAKFSTVTGALTGTPTSTQTGAYSNILISVGNGSATASLAAFSVNVSTGSASLNWTAPSLNVNGTRLTDLAGYTIYYGTNPGELTQTIQLASPSATSYVVNDLSAGTYYFAVAAYTSVGTQSTRSSVGSKTIQ